MTALVPLDQWNLTKFGGRYALKTLRGWAKNGYISPPAQKVGRDWLVQSDAIFKKPCLARDRVNHGLDQSSTDPLVLAILSK